jgi:hypothetical protein
MPFKLASAKYHYFSHRWKIVKRATESSAVSQGGIHWALGQGVLFF